MEDENKAPTNGPEGDKPETGGLTVEEYKAEQVKLRKENADWRRKLRATEEERDQHAARAAKYDSVLVELGVTEEKDFDPKKFVSEYKGVKDSYRRERVNFAVHKAASSLGANSDLLLDSSSFQGKASKLDLTAQDFSDQVSRLVQEAVEANPAYKTSGQAPKIPDKSGPEIPGGASESRITQAELSRMYAAGETGKIAKLVKDGKISHLM